MELTVIVTIAIFFIGVIWGFIKLLNDSAKIKVRFSPGARQSSPTYYVQHVPWEGEENVFNPNLSIMRFHLKWRGEIILSNISKNSTSGVTIHFYNESPKIEIQDFIKPEQILNGYSEQMFHASYNLYQHVAPSKRQETDREITESIIYKDFKILIKYKVFLGINRYTIYTHSTKENKHPFFLPHRFNSHANVSLRLNYYKE